MGAFRWDEPDHSDYGASKEPLNPCPEWIQRFLRCTMIRVIWITDPDPRIIPTERIPGVSNDVLVAVVVVVVTAQASYSVWYTNVPAMVFLIWVA